MRALMRVRFCGRPFFGRPYWIITAFLAFASGWLLNAVGWAFSYYRGPQTATEWLWYLWGVLLCSAITAIPAALVAMPFNTLYLLALKPPDTASGHRCPCGYDLTGNISGRCPECGRGFIRDALPRVVLQTRARLRWKPSVLSVIIFLVIAYVWWMECMT